MCSYMLLCKACNGYAVDTSGSRMCDRFLSVCLCVFGMSIDFGVGSPTQTITLNTYIYIIFVEGVGSTKANTKH